MGSSVECLKEKSVRSQMQTKWAGREIVHLKETVSTNVEAARLAKEGMAHGTLIIAESQTGGKGRRGRSWFSPSGKSVFMSMILKPELEPSKASMLTLVQALAVSRAIKTVSGMNSQIKWPNDIVVNKKKICGILTEMNIEAGSISSIIIGTGINVNQEDFPEEIQHIATSLMWEGKQEVSREELIAKVCLYFEQYYEAFMKMQDLSLLVEEYNASLVSCGKTVKVLDPKGEFTGKALGINEVGELLVEKEDRTVENVYAGEVSVRGLYGYVT